MRLECDREQSITLETARTALMCIDFQSDFLLPTGMAAERGLPWQRLSERVAAAASTLALARQLGMLVIHTRESYSPDLSDLNEFRRTHDTIVGADGPMGRFLIRGEPGTEIVPTMAPRTHEPVIDKAGFNAFFQTSLDTILRTQGISRLLLMGFTTQCCVASTLRGAVDLGYFCVLLKDCSGAFDEADHEASIRVIYSENNNFGWVTDSTRLARAAEQR